ncbi:MAG: ABC transporter ATP-binding protein [Lachnospiraceae bacterium]|nr:ABC transporter ATP-binding protein [Lachnospiraceae bacterium]
MVKVDNLTFGYEEMPVLESLSIEARGGEILLIEGENGSGKTTLLNCITNLVNGGKNIYIEGKEVYLNKNVLKKVAYIMSSDCLYDYLTVRENIAFFKAMLGEGKEYEKKIEALCKEFGITELEDILVKNLSEGTRNKVYLAIMLSKKHSILIMDEPFTALDEGMQKYLLDYVQEYSKTQEKCAILVTHIKEFQRIATRRFLLKKQTC